MLLPDIVVMVVWVWSNPVISLSRPVVLFGPYECAWIFLKNHSETSDTQFSSGTALLWTVLNCSCYRLLIHISLATQSIVSIFKSSEVYFLKHWSIGIYPKIEISLNIQHACTHHAELCMTYYKSSPLSDVMFGDAFAALPEWMGLQVDR